MTEQLAFPGAEHLGRRRSARKPVQPADTDPYAVVLVLRTVPGHSGQFDYMVPARLHASVVPGVRVRVRFRGQLCDGLVLRRAASTTVCGTVHSISSVVGSVAVEPKAIAAWQRLAEQCAGSVAEVARWGLAERHAATEKAVLAEPLVKFEEAPRASAPADSPWCCYPAGAAWLNRVGGTEPVHAVWQAPPGATPDGVARWALAIAESAQRVITRGRTVVVCVPDDASAEQLAAVCASIVGAERVVHYHGGASTAHRYRWWLQVQRSSGWCVVGTRSVAYLPIKDLGLAVCWDDHNELHRARRAPYAHDRDAMQVMAAQHGASTLVGGWSLSAPAWHQAQTGGAVVMEPTRDAVRLWAPTVVVDDPVRAEGRDGPAAYGVIPPVAVRAMREAASRGTVVVQVGRRGYVPVVACRRCSAVVVCPGCGQALELTVEGRTECVGCGPRETRCGECGGGEWRAVTTGLERVAEELRRALPAVPIDLSFSGQRVARSRSALTVCTPGCEPLPEGSGHALAVGLMGGGATGVDADLSWVARALRLGALVASANEGGRLLLVGAEASAQVRNAVAAWAPRWIAEQDGRHRSEGGIPPAVWGAVVRTDAATASWWERYVRSQAGDDGVVVNAGHAVGASGHAVWVRCPPSEGERMAALLFAGRAQAPSTSTVVVGPSPWW